MFDRVAARGDGLKPGAKADLGIARRYAALVEDRLLGREPVLRASIDRRNPYVDPLSFVQVELLRRARANSDDDEALARASFLAINGIAAGMRNTG